MKACATCKRDLPVGTSAVPPLPHGDPLRVRRVRGGVMRIGSLDERPANRRGRPKRDYPPEIIELARSMYEDKGMSVAEIRGAFPKGYRVQTILERHVDQRRPAAKREQRGAANHMWRSDPGYQAAHLRVVAVKGKAADHACVDCGERAKDWSYNYDDRSALTSQHGCPYSTDPNYYEPRCRTCHKRHDNARRTGEAS